MSENLYESSNKEICPYCQKSIEDKFFDDHIMCHELENEEQSNNNSNANNNINQQNNNNINNINQNNNNHDQNDNQNNNINNNNQNNNNNSHYTGGLVYNLLKLFTGTNNNNQNNSNNNSSNNNNNNANSPSTLEKIFSTLSNTFSNINELNRQLNNVSIQYNTNSSSTSRSSSSSSNNINNFFAPPPVVYPSYNYNNNNHHSNNNNNNMQFPSNLDLPSNIANIILPNLIIGERGHVFNPLNPNNNNSNINIDAVMGLLPSSEIKEKKEGDNNNCIICLADFEVGDKVTSLPCLHMFHTDCIKNWLKSKNHCPICKYTITEESLRRGN